MKRICKSVLCVAILLGMQLFSNATFAQNVSFDKAQKVATNYLSWLKGSKGELPTMRMVYSVNNITQDIPAAYVFVADEGGFVIVSGSECEDPIIGYSDEGYIDPNNMPPSLEYWLNSYCEDIMDFQNLNITATSEVKNQWEAILSNTLEPITADKAPAYLLTDRWGQGDPGSPTYNLYCPEKNGRTSVVGCVATAMSQIIRYWQYPAVGQDRVAYKPSGLPYLAVDFDTAYYDYDLMPDRLTTASSMDQVRATAMLCYHAGVSVRMDYDPDGSGTLSELVVQALPKYFKYQTPRQRIRTTMSAVRWCDTLRQEINNLRPIYYSAYDPGSDGQHAGHAFVCDGYSRIDTNKFHFNWGWDGSGNGFYNVLLNDLKPQGMGYHFYSGQDAIINIQPPADSNRFVGIADVMTANLYPAYPNPSNTVVTIPYDLNGADNAVMRIFNIEGKLIETIRLNNASLDVTVDVRNYPKGVYIYQVNGAARKFMVQ